MSFNIALSGLNAAQKDLDVIAFFNPLIFPDKN